MRNSKGFTLIEMLISVVIVLIFGTIVFTGFMNYKSGNNEVSFGWGGMVETRCIGGYKYTLADGRAVQVLSEFGKGVKCE